MTLVRIFLAALILAGSAGCTADSRASDTAGARSGGPPAVPVTTANVVQKPMPIEIQVIGSVEPFSTVAIRSQTTGQLMAVNFREGDIVQQGQVQSVTIPAN